MCGISGFWDLGNIIDPKKYSSILKSMTDELKHRGPDGEGSEIIKNLCFGFRRLSIQDLSLKGMQPMFAKNRKGMIVFNGEVYNFKEIRRNHLSNVTFQSETDTEVILELINKYSFEKALRIFNGMFAIAYFDIEKKCLYIARDRIGKKPLYYSFQNKILGFASELKSLYKIPSFSFVKSKKSIHLFSQLGYIPTPLSIYNNVHKLEQATYLKISKNGEIIKNKYWDFNQNQDQDSYLDLDELDNLINDSVKIRMISDAPLGTFLSGGIDSTLITMKARENKDDLKTFSLGSFYDKYDESKYAFKASSILNTDHNQNYLTDHDLITNLNYLSYFYDEPFADSSQIPTMVNSKYAAEQVKVCLSGDGGDELFGGYPRYYYAKRISKLSNLFSFSKLLPTLSGESEFIKKFNKLKSISKQKGNNKLNELYFNIVSQTNNQEIIINYENNIFNEFNPWNEDKLFEDEIDYFRYIDMNAYLMDDILHKVDRGSMSKSLEVRCPLLDHRIIELVFSKKLKYEKLQTSKIYLRKILEKKFDLSFFDREKKGFSIPVEKYLLGPLKEKCEHYFSKENQTENEILNRKKLNNNWQQLKNGNLSNLYGMWFMYVYHDWVANNNV